MTRAGSESAGISRQRGFWLRCFLGGTLLWAAGCGCLRAQVEMDAPLHLAHVEGIVVNSFGKPLVHAEVTLDQDGAAVYRTRTNDAGAFHFDHVFGQYWFRVERTQYAPAAREVRVGYELASHLERKKLYVIVGPGACADACSSVLTSKREFEKAVQKMPKGPAK